MVRIDTTDKKKSSILKKAWNNKGRVFGLVGLAMCADMAFADGKYGAPAWGIVSPQAERNYRAISRGVGEVRKFIFWSVSDLAKDINQLGDKYGQPRP